MKNYKAVGFFESIVAVKNYLRGFQLVYVSSQLTTSCKMAYVNALTECTNFFEKRKKGRGTHKRQWVIEMSHDGGIDLAMYLWVEILDGRILNAHIFYIVWKYWHYPMNHCLAIKIYSAYDIYLEFCEDLLLLFGKFRILWYIKSSGIYFQLIWYCTIQCRNDIW